MRDEDHDPGRYRVCMQELIHRLGIFKTAVEPFSRNGVVSIANCELAALQLRKMYELVGFASISANKARYVEIRSSYERDWNLAEILNRIERLNPSFLPFSLVETWDAGTPKSPHKISSGEARFDKKQLLEDHGRLGSILHSRNPYSKEIDYRNWLEWMIEKCRDFVGVMGCHGVVVEYQKTMYRVAMRDAETNDVLVAIMNFENVT